MRKVRRIAHLSVFMLAVQFLCGCDSVDDDRIPAMPVSINLSGAAAWNTYGVHGFGVSRRFVKPLGQPAGFPYTGTSATGFGGVLLIGGMDVFTTDSDVPLAYDLSCPVERKPDVRVEVEASTFDAVCPVCQSHYNVTMGGGSPLSGPALIDKYGLKRYRCLPTGDGGYIITN